MHAPIPHSAAPGRASSLRARTARWLAVVVATTLVGVAPRARADAFIAAGEAEVRPLAHRVFIRHERDRQTLVQQIDVHSPAKRFLWIRTFPATPGLEARVEPGFFEALEGTTRVEPPHDRAVRAFTFGPSIVSLLLKRLSRARGVTAEAEPPAEADRSLEILPALVLSERIATSSVSRGLVMPKALRELAAQEGVTLSPATQQEIVSALARGGVVLVNPVHDPRPTSSAPARLGPVRADFATKRALYSVIPAASASHVWYDFYTLGEAVLVPRRIQAEWDEEPWKGPPPPERYVVSFNQPVTVDSEAELVIQRFALAPNGAARLAHARLVLPSDRHTQVELSVRDEGITLPTATRRGSAADLFFCLLGGVGPLFYAPESWFLMWISARARARSRSGRPAGGLHAWASYAVFVGLFWFCALDGTARVAAVIPFFVGVWQLGMPFVEREREPEPIRVEFQKTKKKRKKSARVAKAS